MKKINLFIFALIFLSAALQLNAQTHCGDISYTIQLDALSYSDSDGAGGAEAGIFDLTAINPLNGAAQEDKSCHYEDVPDNQSSPLTT